MKVAAAQFDCTPGDPAANLQTIERFVGSAAAAGCTLVVLPEMADTGYDMDAIARSASTWPGAPILRLQALAKAHHVAIVSGLSLRERNRIYNALAFVDAAGEMRTRYRKTHLFSLEPACEPDHLEQGDALETAVLDDRLLGLMICYDIRFPEMARCLALRGATVFVVVAAWPTARIEHWRLLNRARAIENQVFVVAANRIGADGDMKFGGTSMIVDPYGKELAVGSVNAGENITATLDLGLVDKARSAMRIFHDRRPDLYGPIVEPLDPSGFA